MLYKSKPKQIHLYCKIVDFRKQINGLSAIVEDEFKARSLEDSWFVFISRDKKKVKLLYWRGAGLCLWQYRLDSKKFDLGRPRSVVNREISWSDLGLFLDGYNIFSHGREKLKRYS